MAEGGDIPLTNPKIQRLGAAISQNDMESFALGYLDIDNAIIKNMKREETREAFNREVLFRWRNKNPKNQVVVISSCNILCPIFYYWTCCTNTLTFYCCIY